MAWENGLYRAVTITAPLHTLMLRVDLNDAFAPDGFVSADLYRGFLVTPGATDIGLDQALSELTYLASFRSGQLANQPPNPDALDVALTGIPQEFGNITLQLRGPAGPNDPALRVHYRPSSVPGPLPSVELDFIATRYSPSQRILSLETDVTPGFARPRDLSVTVMDQRLSFEDMLNRAGFFLSPFRDGDSDLPNQPQWSLDQLVEQAQKKPTDPDGDGFFSKRAGASLQTYLMIATRFEGSGSVTGAMFDRAGRRAAAVFYSTLQSAFGGSGDDTEFRANYLFTAVHEVAHCLNLPHAFEDSHLPMLSDGVATFMNYPQKYTGNFGDTSALGFRGASAWDDDTRRRYLRFWSIFGFRFHPQELLELRHGARKDILVGDGVSPYRGGLSATISAMTIGGDEQTGLMLHLRVKRGVVGKGLEESQSRIFEFGEPIHVEARLRSTIDGARLMETPLSAFSGGLEIHYQTPDNQFQPFEPPVTLCDLGKPKAIDGSDDPSTPDSFYNDICLNYVGESVRFLTPGRYRIRASYRYRDAILVSNILEIYVRYPTRQVEDAVVPLLDSDLATYFSFRGVRGLDKFQSRIAESRTDRSKGLNAAKHPLLRYYFAYQGRLTGDKRHFLSALDLPSVGSLRKSNKTSDPVIPFSNMMLGRIWTWFRRSLSQEDSRLKKSLATWVKAVMRRRGIPSEIIRQYDPPPSE
jgi:hypothetical protein